jgi:acid phosphatase type 7
MIRLSVVSAFLAVLALAAWPDRGSAQEAVVWAVGDAGDGSEPAHMVEALIQADNPDALLYLGDVYPEGRAEDFAESFDPVFGPLKGITWPTHGNHDWANRRTGYRPYWRTRIGGRDWYRVRIGGWEVVSLSSEARHDKRSPQVSWLKRVLSKNSGTCRLAFWHRPLRSPGTVHGGTPNVAPLWKALRGHARLVVNAHEHLMSRFRTFDGMTEYVSGAGGYTLYGARPDPRTMFVRTGVQGALRIALSPRRAALEFRDVTGQVLDSSGARCRPLKPVRRR